MYNLYIKDDELVNEVIKIVEQFGISLQSAVELFLARIKRDKNLSFLIENKKYINENSYNNKTYSTQNKIEMNKSKAMYLFGRMGYKFNEYTTFSSKNKSSYVYWANPSVKFLEHNWHLILNDCLLGKLYLFEIPANEFSLNDLVTRSDNFDLLDIQIAYQDPLFTENRSHNPLQKYLIETIDY